jgi:hypothetical protein
MNDYVPICDIVDRANLNYECTDKSLRLDGTTDVQWALQLNVELS